MDKNKTVITSTGVVVGFDKVKKLGTIQGSKDSKISFISWKRKQLK